jgi:hypothetical protein
MLNVIIILGLLNTTLIHCFNKWGWMHWYGLHRYGWMPSADCYLCIGFWMAVIELPAVWHEWYYMLVPICSAALTNWLVNQALLTDYRK